MFCAVKSTNKELNDDPGRLFDASQQAARCPHTFIFDLQCDGHTHVMTHTTAAEPQHTTCINMGKSLLMCGTTTILFAIAMNDESMHPLSV